MVNQMNKVRKNLTRSLRARKHGFKAAVSRTPTGLVRLANAKVVEAVEQCNADIETPQEEELRELDNNTVVRAFRKAEKKEGMVALGKLGKNNSIVHPTILNKKKTRRLRTQQKYLQQRLAAKNGTEAMDVEMAIDEPAPSAPVEQPAVSKPSGNGTTLGAPR